MYYKKELYKRGYNQSEKLARYLSTQLDIPCVPLLEKIQPTTPQMQKSRKDRTKLSPHVYTIIPNKIPPNTIILLVDDIVTTGSTFQTTSSVIKSFFPTNPIRGVCIARNK